jgi:hypothetical protein
MDHLVIAISRDPSHDQLPNADTIAYTSKILLKRPWYSCLLWDYACRGLANTEVDAHSQLLNGPQGPQWRNRESTQGTKGNCNPIGGTTIWTKQYPRALVSSCICIKRWPSRPSLQGEAHWTCKLYMPQYREMPGPKRGSGWVGE